jgi:hypothetical protein
MGQPLQRQDNLDLNAMTLPPNNVTPLNAANSSVIPRVEKGHFARGGPGRPRGSRNKASSELLKTVKSMSGRAIAKLSEALDRGDRYAVEFILSHSLPQGRTIELFDADTENVRAAFCEGDISSSEFREISTSLEKLASLDSIEDIRTRLAQLEEMIAKR